MNEVRCVDEGQQPSHTRKKGVVPGRQLTCASCEWVRLQNKILVTCSSSSGGGTSGTGGGGESGSGSGGAGAGASEGGGDRLAQASARFLADYLLAVGGGAGGGGGLYKLNPVNT